MALTPHYVRNFRSPESLCDAADRIEMEIDSELLKIYTKGSVFHKELPTTDEQVVHEVVSRYYRAGWFSQARGNVISLYGY